MYFMIEITHKLNISVHLGFECLNKCTETHSVPKQHNLEHFTESRAACDSLLFPQTGSWWRTPKVGPIPTVCHARWYGEGGWGGGRALHQQIHRTSETALLSLRPSHTEVEHLSLYFAGPWPRTVRCVLMAEHIMFSLTLHLRPILTHEWSDACKDFLESRLHSLSFLHMKLEGDDQCNHFLLAAVNGVCSKRFRDVHSVGSFPPYDLGNKNFVMDKILLSTREQGIDYP